MSSTCLSLAPNLRCQHLTRPESIGVLIPPSLELVFCLGLIIAKHGLGLRKDSLLSAEGAAYFLLAILDFAAHNSTSIRDSLPHFKALDIFVGISSTVPLSLFLGFLFLLARKDLIPILPHRVQATTKYALILQIPLILIFNLVASFASLTYGFAAPPTDPARRQLGVLYTEHNVHVFFDSLTLVLLLTFQATNFVACFYRLVLALMDQRRIDVVANGNDHERHLFRGTAWIAVGIKLGFVETIIGFANGAYGLALTRRILRLLSRACLIIGTLKGMDAVEDFKFIKQVPPTGRRRSVILGLIGEPKSESFRQIGGHQYEPTTAPPAAVTRSRTINRTSGLRPLFLSNNSSGFPVLDNVASDLQAGHPYSHNQSADGHDIRQLPHSWSPPSRPTPALTLDTRSVSMASSDHVTVRYQHGRAPTLDLRRFSDIDLTPATETVGEGFSPKLIAPVGDANEDNVDDDDDDYRERRTSMTTPRMSTSFSILNAPTPMLPRARHTIGGTEVAPQRSRSSRSTASKATTIRKSSQTYPYTNRADTLEVLHALAMEFPAMPIQPAAAGIAPSLYPSEEIGADGSEDTEADTAYPDSETLSRSASQRTENSRTGLVRRSSSRKRKPAPKLDDDSNAQREPQLSSAAVKDASTAPDAAKATEHKTMVSLPSNPRPKSRPQTIPAPPEPMPRNVSVRESRQSAPTPTSIPQAQISYPSLHSAMNGASSDKVEMNGAYEESRSGLVRIKSIGSAPRRWTPTPASNEYTRESIVAEWHDTRGDGAHLVYPTPPLSATGFVFGGETV